MDVTQDLKASAGITSFRIGTRKDLFRNLNKKGEPLRLPFF